MSRRDARIDADRVVQQAARAHGIRSRHGLLGAIVRAAEAQVARWFDELGEQPSDLADVHRVILNRCRLRVERIESEEDLARVKSRYARPALPIQLELEFAQGTEALVFRNHDVDARSSSNFIAVVDARADRAARAWFAERHEPAHILCRDPGINATFRRTPVNRQEPIERVVDAVAARVGFWPPIVKPALLAALAQKAHILDAFEEVRRALVPHASVEASYRAFAQLCERPVLLLRCSYATRKSDKIGTSSALRATTVIYNQLAINAGMRVPMNFRIPADSIITTAQASHISTTQVETDDLGRWKDSTGKRLGPCRVRVMASRSWAALVPY